MVKGLELKKYKGPNQLPEKVPYATQRNATYRTVP